MVEIEEKTVTKTRRVRGPDRIPRVRSSTLSMQEARHKMFMEKITAVTELIRIIPAELLVAPIVGFLAYEASRGDKALIPPTLACDLAVFIATGTLLRRTESSLGEAAILAGGAFGLGICNVSSLQAMSEEIKNSASKSAEFLKSGAEQVAEFVLGVPETVREVIEPIGTSLGNGDTQDPTSPWLLLLDALLGTGTGKVNPLGGKVFVVR